MLFLDPPDHTRVRSIFTKAFRAFLHVGMSACAA
jgi:cytochrome P450